MKCDIFIRIFIAAMAILLACANEKPEDKIIRKVTVLNSDFDAITVLESPEDLKSFNSLWNDRIETKPGFKDWTNKLDIKTSTSNNRWLYSTSGYARVGAMNITPTFKITDAEALNALLKVTCTPRLRMEMKIPDSFYGQNISGDPEPLRYERAYKAFWWRCVDLKSKELSALCPAGCSGTPASSYGCTEGGFEAEKAINELVDKCGAEATQKHLQTLVCSPEHIKAIQHYFRDETSCEKP